MTSRGGTFGGKVAMCRAKRSTQPLDHTAEQLQALIAVAVGD
ncbi:hypothetical protein [Streptomyces daliensis]